MFPCPSSAVIVTGTTCSPFTTVPGAGDCVSVNVLMPQVEVTVVCGVKSGSVALQSPSSGSVCGLTGQVIIGGWLSMSCTMKSQVPTLPAASVAVSVTVTGLSLISYIVPAAGDWATVTPPWAGSQLSCVAARLV